MIVLFFFGKFTFLPMAELFELRPTFVWIGLSVLTCVIGGLLHGWLALSVVARAREQQFLVHQFDETKKRSEMEKKINSRKESAP